MYVRAKCVQVFFLSAMTTFIDLKKVQAEVNILRNSRKKSEMGCENRRDCRACTQFGRADISTKYFEGKSFPSPFQAHNHQQVSSSQQVLFNF